LLKEKKRLPEKPEYTFLVFAYLPETYFPSFKREGGNNPPSLYFCNDLGVLGWYAKKLHAKTELAEAMSTTMDAIRVYIILFMM